MFRILGAIIDLQMRVNVLDVQLENENIYYIIIGYKFMVLKVRNCYDAAMQEWRIAHIQALFDKLIRA